MLTRTFSIVSGAILLFAAAVAFLLFMTSTQAAVPFPDVLNTHANAEAITSLNAMGVVFGDSDTGNFSPDRTLNRAEYSIMIARAEGWDIENVAYRSVFPDVKEGLWYTKAILKANEEGVLQGTGEGKAEPGREVLMVEALAMTMRAYKITVPEPTGSQKWYDPYLALAADMGIDTKVSAEYDQNLPRDEAAQMLFNAIASIKPNLLPSEVGPGEGSDDVTQIGASLVEWDLILSEETVEPGKYIFAVTNNGTMRHTFDIEGPGVDESLNLNAGQSDTLTVTLQAGTYDVFCAVSGHRQLGQQATLTVTPNQTSMESTGPFTFATPAFADGGVIPEKYSCNNNPNSDNSPPLTISGTPAGTQSLAIIMDDPDAQEVIGDIADHWVVWNLDASTTIISESHLPDNAEIGMGLEAGKYIGPCPPPGRTHTYHFRLFALDTKLDLAGTDVTRDQLESAMAGHVTGSTEFTGSYTPSS